MKFNYFRRGEQVHNPTPHPTQRCDGYQGKTHPPHDYMAMATIEGKETFAPFWCDGGNTADTEVIPAVQDAPTDYGQYIDRVLTEGVSPEPATAPLDPVPPTQGPDSPENRSADDSGQVAADGTKTYGPPGSVRNPILLNGSPNKLMVERTHDDVWYVPWDGDAMSTGDRGDDFTMLRGEFHPSVKPAIDFVRSEREKGAPAEEDTTWASPSPEAVRRKLAAQDGSLMHQVAERLARGESVPVRHIPQGHTPGVPTVNMAQGLQFAGELPDHQDLLVIKNDDGRDLLSLRVRDGKVEARYYMSDMDEAARQFINFLRDRRH